MMFYKKKYIVICACSVLLALAVFLFQTDKLSEAPMNISFSREPGFYEDAFELTIDAQGREIFYTLDGTVPDKSSMKYENPISIADASQNENVHSMRTDVSGGFETDVIESMGFKSPGFQTPDYLIDKATIIRAVAYDGHGQYSDIITGTYFVGLADKASYENMQVLSIVTDPENLFDYEHGIYVQGKTYDEYKQQYREQGIWDWREEFWSAWLGNYSNRGSKWEREAVCQFFAADQTCMLSQTCGIRIHGAFSRGGNPKSLNIYARKEYDGNRVFDAELFENEYLASAVTLFHGGQDTTLVKDVLVSEAISELNVAAMHFQPYVLFLDGEYWGVYWLNDKYSAEYLEYNYDINKDNVILVKNGALEVGEVEDSKYYDNMIRFCTESDMTNAENYQKACDIIDINSCIDYYATMLYVGRNSDWPGSNFACWRAKEQEHTFYGDGKWRWMLFDFNSAGFDVEFDSLNYVMENDAMFRNMMANDEFRTKLLARITEMADTIFDAEQMSNKIDKLTQLLAEPMRENDKRFTGDDSLKQFYEGTEALKNFFSNRKEKLLPMLEEYR